MVVGALPADGRGDGVAETVADLRAAGVRAGGRDTDVGDLAQVEALRDEALALGGLDIWVNNAGAPGVYGPTHLVDPADFERVLAANVRGVFHGTRTALRVMLDQGSGHVVNVWGKGATKPVPLQNTYASSKAWNRMFTRAVRAEVAGTGVSVHGFDPGLVLTEMLGRVTVVEGLERRVQALPFVAGLWGQAPEAAAKPVLELVTGEHRDYRDLTTPRLVSRGVRSVLAGNLRRGRRMPLDITVVPRDVIRNEEATPQDV